MPSISKNIIIFLLALICVGALTIANPALATPLKLQVDIGGMSSVPFDGTTGPIAKYINAIYQYAVSVVGIVAAIVMMFGGLRWLMAGGNSAAIEDAKQWIFAALSGLILVLTSYTILYIVNPGLVSFSSKNISEVGSFGCCETASGSTMVTKEQCTDLGADNSFYQDKKIKDGKCVENLSKNVCCFSNSSCGFTNLCSGTILTRQECCASCTISWYKNNIDSNINNCGEIPEFTGGSEGEW